MNERIRRVMKYIILVVVAGLISGLLYQDTYYAVIIASIVGITYVLLDMHIPTVVTVK